MSLPNFEQIKQRFPEFEPVTSAIEQAARAQAETVQNGEEVNITEIVAQLATSNPDLFTAMFWIKYLELSRGTNVIDDYFYQSYSIASVKKGEYGDSDGGLTLYETFLDKPSISVDIKRYRS